MDVADSKKIPMNSF